MIASKKKNGSQIKKEMMKGQKIKSVERPESSDFQFNESSDQKPTQEELEEFKNALFSDDTDMQQMAVNFFSNVISFITPDIFQRILAFKECSDVDLISEVVNFLTKAILSKEISQDLIVDPNTASFLSSILQNTQDKLLQSLTINSILKLSERSNDACKTLYSQGVFLRCYQIIEQSLTNVANNLQLIADCLKYINMIYQQLDSNQCDSLSNIAASLYQSLIESSKLLIQQSTELYNLSISLGKLTIYSIHFFVMQCSDQGLLNIFNENLINFINFMINPGNNQTLYLVLVLFVAISYHDSKFIVHLLPIFTNILQMYLNSSTSENQSVLKREDSLTIQLLGTIRNLSASDDQEILSFIASQPVIMFLQSSLTDQTYFVVKQATAVFAYLSSSSIDTFKQVILENNQNIIISMIESLDINDPDSIADSFTCLNNLLNYLQKTSPDSLDDCIQLIRSTDIERIIDDVLNSNLHENLLELTRQLSEILCFD